MLPWPKTLAKSNKALLYRFLKTSHRLESILIKGAIVVSELRL